MPGNVRIGDIATAVGANAKDMKGRKTGGHEKQLVVIDHGGNELFRRPLDTPVASAIVRVEADDFFAARENHLRSAANFANDWCDVTAGLIAARRSPNGLPRLFVEGHDIRIAIVIAVDDDEVLVDHGAR